MSKQSFAAWVDGAEFDALAYSYRMADPSMTVMAFNGLRATIKGKHMLAVAQLKADKAELVDLLGRLTKQISRDERIISAGLMKIADDASALLSRLEEK